MPVFGVTEIYVVHAEVILIDPARVLKLYELRLGIGSAGEHCRSGNKSAYTADDGDYTQDVRYDLACAAALPDLL